MPTEYIVEKNAGGMHVISLESTDALPQFNSNNKRVICRLNDVVEFHAAILPRKQGGYYINISAAVCKKLKIKAGSKVTAAFAPDESRYQFEMPEEMAAVLESDAEADSIFHALTPGNQRGLIYLVQKMQSPDKRIEKALKIADKIKAGITSPRLVLK